MEDNIFDQIQEVDLKKTMETSYIDYAMSVIAARALPDVRDGLKPVQRRILFSMNELGNTYDKPHKKCARIVGDTMGKYHPHGDSSIYGALVNMAQDWNMRYTLIDGHGNFGSMDGDGAAAMRYTEARLAKMAAYMIEGLEKDTVDFIPNYDETEKEPTVLPARFPNLLVNGTTGIAVGMATNIPPHNLREVVAAVDKIIDNEIEEDRETSIDEIMEIIKGPDFPTGGVILGHSGIEEAYRTGRGKVRVRAVTEIEPMENGKNRIVVTELPYNVNKAKLVEYIGKLARDKKLDGITALRDESSREGMRIVIELRRDVNPNVMLNQLYKHTQLQDTYGVNMLALVNNEPKVMSIKEMLEHYLNHQREVVTRRTQFELKKAEERNHIIEGLLIAQDNIDEVISIIRGSKDTASAKASLIERFGLTEVQANAIVEMRLRALTGLERSKLEEDHKNLLEKIAELKDILANPKRLLTVVREEITAIADKFGDDRRTTIGFDEYDINMEDMIPKKNTILTFTKLGYIKRMDIDNFRAQHRGGKGVKGMETIEDDYIVEMMMTMTHDYLMFFTNFGRVYRLKVYEVPEASRTARGTAIVNLLQLQPDEKVTAMIPLREYKDDEYLFMATKTGIVKKTRIKEYMNVRKNGLAAIHLKDDDRLIEVKIINDEDEIMLFTKFGQCIRFKSTDVRCTGRTSMGVIGMNLSDQDDVIAMNLLHDGESVVIVAERGIGKCTLMSEFSTQHRGGKGVKCYKVMDKTGNLVGIKAVDHDDELMIITTEGTVIRIAIADTALSGRITSGVKLINLKENEGVASIAKVKKEDLIFNEEEMKPDEELVSDSNKEQSAEKVEDTESSEEEN